MYNFSLFLKENGISRKQISEILNLSNTFIGQIDRGEKKLPTKWIDILLEKSKEYGWSTRYLLETSDDSEDGDSLPDMGDSLSKDELSQAFATFLKKNHLAQKDIAQMLGVSNAFISQVCKKSCSLPKDKLEDLKGKAETQGLDISMFQRRPSAQVEVTAQGDVYSNVDGEMNINGNKEGMKSLSHHIEILQAALDEANKRNATLLKMLDDEREKFLKMLDDERTRHSAQMQKLIEKL